MALALKGLWFADSDPSLPSWLVEPIYHRRNSQSSQSVSQHLSQQESRVKVLVYFIFVIFPSLSFLWFYHILVFFNVIILVFFMHLLKECLKPEILWEHIPPTVYMCIYVNTICSVFSFAFTFTFTPPKFCCVISRPSKTENWRWKTETKMKDGGNRWGHF